MAHFRKRRSPQIVAFRPSDCIAPHRTVSLPSPMLPVKQGYPDATAVSTSAPRILQGVFSASSLHLKSGRNVKAILRVWPPNHSQIIQKPCRGGPWCRKALQSLSLCVTKILDSLRSQRRTSQRPTADDGRFERRHLKCAGDLRTSPPAVDGI